MDKIIIFPGTISSNFFTNELPYIKKHFDIAAVIAYKEPYETIRNIITENHLNVRQIKNKDLSVFFNRRFWKWLLCKDTKEEIRTKAKGSHRLKKFLYIIYYGIFCVQACRAIEDIMGTMGEDDTVYLYSYWLSRSAYAISYYRMTHINDKRIKHIVSRAHGYDLYEERNNYCYLPFREIINKYLDAIYFIAEDGKKYFDERYSFSKEGALKQVYRLGTYNKAGFIKNFRPKNTICIVSCSAVRKVKRLDLIIDLVAQLGDHVHWVHIGDGELLDEIKAYAKKKLPSGKYTFIGQVDNASILTQYEKYDADFFINLSDSEGIPVSIMEAMSYGLPCIGRNVGGMREIVNEKTGLLLDENLDEIEMIKQYINMRLDNIENYKEVSDDCRMKWKAEYDADKNYEAFFGGLKHE